MRNQRDLIAQDLYLQKIQADRTYNWNTKAMEWSGLLESLKNK